MKKQKYTNQQKRKLTYDKHLASEAPKQVQGLEIPQNVKGKISEAEYKKIKQAFFIQASLNYMLTKQQFVIVIRSLGVVQKTAKLYQIFDQMQKKEMSWRQFLQAYIALRNQKGSYNQLAHAIYALDKEYHGDWDQLYVDLQRIGDVLTAKEIHVFKEQILKGKTINNQTLINSLLGYK